MKRTNGGAFEATETRTGIPLGYVAGQCLDVVVSAHLTLRRARSTEAHENVEWAARVTLADAAKAFSAINNALDVCNDAKLVDRLALMDEDQFRQWTRTVEEAGDVLG
jgi:hypothetical protein